MKQELAAAVQAAVQQLFDVTTDVELTHPEEQFGDFATNIALQLAKQVGKSPHDIAEALAEHLRDHDSVVAVEVAGPGFLNFTLSDQAALAQLALTPTKSHVAQQVLVEFGDPNPFKEMHLGHLYTTVVGDVIARLLKASGASVERLSYHGDVGIHVAKAIWAIQKRLLQQPDLAVDDLLKPGVAIGTYYAEGAAAFDTDEQAAEQIKQLNAHIYAKDDAQINQIYEAGKTLSFQNFDIIFAELDVNFAKRYLESESSAAGLETVTANVGTVFEESEGAVVYRGEKVGLHTRVFINSRGLPTYETKDLGLAELKARDYPTAAGSIIITAHEQTEYFKVMLAALAEIDAVLAAKTRHLAHGFLSLTTGKMSSRSGQVFAARDLLQAVAAAVAKQFPDSAVQKEVYLAAVKYTFLKNRIGGDIVFDVEESVALEGNSGPYLQYAHARARSILRKAEAKSSQLVDLQPAERSLVRKLGEYAEVVDKAVAELLPHHVCSYLFELAQTFNRFYENNRVVGDPREASRLTLVEHYAKTLKNGLQLLGIPAPDKM